MTGNRAEFSGGRARRSILAAAATAATATALHGSYSSMAWVLPVLGVIVGVAAAGILADRLGLPTPLRPLAGLSAVIAIATGLQASEEAFAGLFPGPAAMEVLRGLIAEGVEDIRLLAAPVPVNPGLLLLTVLGVGLIAVAVDTLSVVLDRPALAGLPLLALFAVPSSVTEGGVGWLPFVLGGTAFLALLLADGRDRLDAWGRAGAGPAPVGSAAQATQAAPLTAAGRRIGLAAMAVAVILPTMTPGLSGGLPFRTGSGEGLGTAGGVSRAATTINPIVRLRGYLNQRAPRTVMRITADADPGYVRLAALDRFDGRTWSQSRLSAGEDDRVADGVPRPQGLSRRTETTRVRSRVEVTGAFSSQWLPAPYPVVRVEAEDDWRYDRGTETIFSARANARRSSYELVTLAVRPDPADLAAAPDADAGGMERYLRLPDDMSDPAILDQVGRVLRGAKGPSKYEQAVAIQNYLRTFAYDVTVPAGNSSDDLINFLEVRRGYCEQFAATMAIFARMAGIPARVAIGFTSGQRQSSDRWTVTTDNAHAWPELYFEGAGWLPFEPTPGGGGGTAAPPPGYGGAAEYREGGAAAPVPGPTAAPLDRRLAESLRGDAVAPTVPGPVSAREPADRRWALPLLLASLAVLAGAPAGTRLAVRRRRWAGVSDAGSQADAAWRQLRDDARDYGFFWSDGASPRSAGAALIRAAALGESAAAAVRALVTAEEHARYAGSAAGAGGSEAELHRLSNTVRSALADASPWHRRLRAVLLPTSSLRRAGHVAEATADVVNGWERRAAAWRPALKSRLAGRSA